MSFFISGNIPCFKVGINITILALFDYYLPEISISTHLFLTYVFCVFIFRVNYLKTLYWGLFFNLVWKSLCFKKSQTITLLLFNFIDNEIINIVGLKFNM